MKAVSDVKLNIIVQKIKDLINGRVEKEKIQQGAELPDDAPDGTIFFLIQE